MLNDVISNTCDVLLRPSVAEPDVLPSISMDRRDNNRVDLDNVRPSVDGARFNTHDIFRSLAALHTTGPIAQVTPRHAKCDARAHLCHSIVDDIGYFVIKRKSCK